MKDEFTNDFEESTLRNNISANHLLTSTNPFLPKLPKPSTDNVKVQSELLPESIPLEEEIYSLETDYKLGYLLL